MKCVKEQKEMLKMIIENIKFGNEEDKRKGIAQLETFYTMLEVKENEI